MNVFAYMCIIVYLKPALDPMELDLRLIESHHVGAGSGTNTCNC